MCKFCEQEIIQGEDELDFYDKGYYWDNEIEIADESGFSTLYMGVLRNGKYYISASGDDRAWYYPKYCPECGRRLAI